MPTVSQGSSQILNLGPNDSYKVTVADAGDAYVDLLSGAPGSPYMSPRIRAPGTTKSFGPYGVPAVLRIRAIVGEVAYEQVGQLLSVRQDSFTKKLYNSSGEVVDAGGSVVSISGTLQVGQVLTATPSSGWQVSAGQWYRAGAAISGATGLTYTLVVADQDKLIEFAPTGLPFRAVAGVVAAAPVIPTPGVERIVSTHGRQPSVLNAASSLTYAEFRFPLYIGRDTPFVRIAFDNQGMNNDSSDALPPTDLILDSVALESVSNPQARALSFGGGAAVTIAPGNNVESDAIQASQFGLSKFTRGEQYWVRCRAHVTSTSGQFPATDMFQIAGAKFSTFDVTAGSNSVSNVMATGAMPAKTGESVSTIGYSFTCAIGQVDAADGLPSMTAIGTSIASGASDDRSIPSALGFMNRAAFNGTFEKPIPIINQARGSSTAVGLAASLARKARYWKYCDVMLCDHGTNDTDATALMAAVQTIWARFKQESPAGKIIHSKMVPRPASTSNQWSNQAGQTTDSSFVTKASTFATFLNGKVGDGTLLASPTWSGVFDAAAPDKWASNGTTLWMTDDGIHPLAIGHRFMSAILRGILEANFPAIQGTWSVGDWKDALAMYLPQTKPGSMFAEPTFATPSSVGGTVQGLLDLMAGSSLTNANGATVSPTYVTDSLRATPALKFTAANVQRMSKSSPFTLAATNGTGKGYTMLFAFRRGAPNVSVTLACFFGVNGDYVRFYVGGTNTIGVQASVGGVANLAASAVLPALASDAWNVAAFRYNGSAWTITLNGVEVVTNVALSMGVVQAFGLGGVFQSSAWGVPFDGEFAAVAMSNQSASNADLALAQTAFGGLVGLTI